jgi:hypothetical protein
MSTKLSLSLALALGLSACVAEVDDDDVLTGDDLETVAEDPGADLESDLTGEPTEPNAITNDGTTTCSGQGGQPRRKADGPCLPE